MSRRALRSKVFTFSLIIPLARSARSAEKQALLAPVFQTVARTTGSIEFIWRAAAGLMYQMQYTTDLNPIVWNNLGSPVAPTNGTVTATDTITASRQRFYRIVELP
ncbi:MAG: hypothetical protein ABI651_19050 [Verrucomicrobiota bacterium]